MARHHVTRVLPYTPDQVFALVGDVKTYPDFIPWITAMETGAVREEAAGVSVVDARAAVGFSFLKEAFSTRVRRDAGRRTINVSLISGPFRHLENVWTFRPHPQGCEVVFDIDFQFKARMLDLVLKANFGYAVDRLIACFEGRARQLYGTGGAPSPIAATAVLAPS
jgi:coenzyme Q-binding protein COQ10